MIYQIVEFELIQISFDDICRLTDETKGHNYMNPRYFTLAAIDLIP